MSNIAEPVPGARLLDAGGPEMTMFINDAAAGLKGIIVIHETLRGPAFGGLRMRPYPSEAAALRECLRLAEAMSYKHAAANLPYGGGKSVIFGDPARDKTGALLEAYASFVARLGGSYLPGVDIGTSPEDLQEIRRHGCDVTCADEDPARWTALGVYAALRAGVEEALGTSSLAGVRVGIQGTGHVGAALAELLAADGAELVVADARPEVAERVAQAVGGTVVGADAILGAVVDVFAPCATGALLGDDTIPQLRCKVVAGAANEVLQDPDRHGDALHARGILYAPDFISNAGGVISVHGRRESEDDARITERVLAIGDEIRATVAHARAHGISPAAAAHARVMERLRVAG
jgi:leucine dehydrogenase